MTLLLVLTSCNAKDYKVKRYCKNLINSELLLPSNLSYYFNGVVYDKEGSILSYHVEQECYKIVFWIDGDCNLCINRIDSIRNWKLSFDLDELEIICYVKAMDYKGFVYYLKSYTPFEFPIIFDPENSFLISNGLIADENLSCVLVDGQNTIKLIGDPARSVGLSELFLRYLKPINANYIK